MYLQNDLFPTQARHPLTTLGIQLRLYSLSYKLNQNQGFKYEIPNQRNVQGFEFSSYKRNTNSIPFKTLVSNSANIGEVKLQRSANIYWVVETLTWNPSLRLTRLNGNDKKNLTRSLKHGKAKTKVSKYVNEPIARQVRSYFPRKTFIWGDFSKTQL